MLKRLFVSLHLLAMGLLGISNLAEGHSQDFEKAQEAYQAGRFDEASRLYLQLVQESQPSASLYHNLGLSLDRQKQLGGAVAAYLRAVQLQPRHGDFRYNLEFLLNQTQDKLDAKFLRATPTNILLDRWLSERELFYLGLGCFGLAVAFAVSLLLRKREQEKTGSRSALAGGSALVFFTLTLYVGASLLYRIEYAPDLGAVALPKLEAYSGPTQSVVIFELHAGSPLQILEISGDWVKIELSDQKRGWVKRAGIISFGRRSATYPSVIDVSSES